MNSIRARLTLAYAMALIGTMITFAVVLLFGRRMGTYRELGSHVATEANLVLTIIRQTEAAKQPVTITKDSLIGPTITPNLRTLLEVIPDYMMVLDSTGRTLFVSDALRRLSADDRLQLQQYAIEANT